MAHLGLMNAEAQPGDACLGRMAEQVMRDGRANNLANLARYPGVHSDPALLAVPCLEPSCLSA